MAMKGYLLAVAMVVVLVAMTDAGCRDAGCCRGKDNKCKSKGERMTPKTNSTNCFCDETCLILGDCCTDYHDACRAEDCEQGDWDNWGDCSESCGWGHKIRSRPVYREGKYGGKKCDTTLQKTYCLGITCKDKRNNQEAVSETARVIPAQYGGWRKDKAYNPFKDIRSNIFEKKYKDNKITAPSYCAKFEVIEARKACSNPLAKGWASSLEAGQTVCVECQASAMKKSLGTRCRGHGAYLLETRWNAVTIPGCHGKWVKKTQERTECECDGADDHSFILI